MANGLTATLIYLIALIAFGLYTAISFALDALTKKVIASYQKRAAEKNIWIQQALGSDIKLK